MKINQLLIANSVPLTFKNGSGNYLFDFSIIFYKLSQKDKDFCFMLTIIKCGEYTTHYGKNHIKSNGLLSGFSLVSRKFHLYYDIILYTHLFMIMF